MSNELDLLQISEWSHDVAEENVEEEENCRESPAKEILWAAENNKLKIAKKLLELNPEIVNSTDKDGYTPLHRACYNNFADMVDLLLNYNANVNAETVDNWQPLHSACKWNSVDCAAILLERGANPNSLSKGGQTPLHIAASQSTSYEVMELLLMHPFIDTSVKNSVNETCFDIAKRSFKYIKLLDMAKDLFQPIRKEF